MADAGVPQVDDGTSCVMQSEIAGINIGDPVQCLLGRGDVVSVGTEHHHRYFDPFQVNATVLAAETAGQLVADEKVIDNPLNLFAIEQGRAAPPAFEVEEARSLAVDLAEQLVVLGPIGVGRVQVFEIADQPGTVKAAIAQVAAQASHPAATQQASGIAHRIASIDTGPVRQGGTIDNDQSRQFRSCCSQSHQRPARLAVTDDDRLAVGRVKGADDFDEPGLGFDDIGQGLPRLWRVTERDEIGGVAGSEAFT
ncbi:hypothetical protein D3C71_1119340 [compost metagenome]